MMNKIFRPGKKETKKSEDPKREEGQKSDAGGSGRPNNQNGTKDKSDPRPRPQEMNKDPDA